MDDLDRSVVYRDKVYTVREHHPGTGDVVLSAPAPHAAPIRVPRWRVCTADDRNRLRTKRLTKIRAPFDRSLPLHVDPYVSTFFYNRIIGNIHTPHIHRLPTLLALCLGYVFEQVGRDSRRKERAKKWFVRMYTSRTEFELLNHATSMRVIDRIMKRCVTEHDLACQVARAVSQRVLRAIPSPPQLPPLQPLSDPFVERMVARLCDAWDALCQRYVSSGCLTPISDTCVHITNPHRMLTDFRTTL